MALNRNKVELAGFLGDAPEIRYFPDGTPVATIRLASTERWKDKKTGQQREHTEWHRVVFKGRPAEVAGEYLGKGSHIFVDGKLRTRNYELNGEKRYITEIVGNFQIIDRKPVDAGSIPTPPKDDAPLPDPDDMGDDFPA
ncbi:TPA: single-stranded DNA-binding protein [Pseudomonas aeruginosa]|nr:single-stranded DNA-binding protein [Pseudomonas aeruginosa]